MKDVKRSPKTDPSQSFAHLLIQIYYNMTRIKCYHIYNLIEQPNNFNIFMIRLVNKNPIAIFNQSYLTFFQRNKLTQKNIYATAFAEKKMKKKEQMKPYQVLLYSPIVSQINMYALMSSSELRPSAATRLLQKSSRSQQFINSTQISIQTVFFMKQTKYFEKGYVLLVQNLLKIMINEEKLDKCGIFKPGVMQKLLYIISKFQSLHGQSCIQTISVFIIKAIEKSNKNKKEFDNQKKEIDVRMEDLKPLLNDTNLSQDQKKQVFNQYLIQRQLLVQLEWKYPNMQQEDYIIALNFLLEKGYYNKNIISLVNEIIKKDYNLETVKQMTEKRQKVSKNAHICSLFKLINAKLKLLNSFKSYKSHKNEERKIKKQQKLQKQETEKQKDLTSQKPNENIPIDQTITQYNKEDYDIQKLIMTSKQYQKLVKMYIDMLQNPEYLNNILDDKTVMLAENLQTDFYSYILKKRSKKKQSITIVDIKKSYINVLKMIFDVRKNGITYAHNKNVLGMFQIIIKLFDYEDRHEVVQLLKCFENFSLMTNLNQFQNYSVFYVCEKYKYRSNFLASKYIKSIIKKYNREKDQISLKQQMIFGGVQMCKNISLYFKLLQSQQNSTLNSTIEQYNNEINQAVDIFLNHYNKLISVLYFQDQKLGFIDKCVQMSQEVLKKKKMFKNNEEDIPLTQDLKKVIKSKQKIISSFISTAQIKNFYFPIEKIFNIKKSQISQKVNNKQSIQFEKNKKWKSYKNEKEISKKQTNEVKEQEDYCVHSYFIKHQTNLQIIAQIYTVFDIVLTAIRLQKHKNVLSMDDAHVVLKSVFCNQKNKKIILKSMAYPKLLKILFQIGNHFKNESNENLLWKLIYKSTKYDVNQIIRDQRLNFAKTGKQLFSLDEQIQVKTQFQENLTALTLTPITLKNVKLQKVKDYEASSNNIMSNLRSDVIYSADKIYGDLKKLAKEQLFDAIQKSKDQKTKNIKFQTSYLQYPYLADIAINKNKQVTIILIREKNYLIKNIQRTSDKAIEQYLDECQKYYKEGKLTVCIITNLAQLKQLIRTIVN